MSSSSISPNPHQQQPAQYSSSSSRSRVSIASSKTDPQTLHILKKFGLDEVVPQPQDFQAARAERMNIDGSTTVFAGGKPITRRRDSSSPAVTEALARGFKLTHFPARALLPEDQFSDSSHNRLAGTDRNMFDDFAEREMAKNQAAAAAATASGSRRQPSASSSSISPDPRIHRGASSGSGSLADIQRHQEQSLNRELKRASVARQQQEREEREKLLAKRQAGAYKNLTGSYHDDPNSARIPPNIDPHVLPQGALLQPLPPARELLENETPLQQTTKFDKTNKQWLEGVDAGDWALSDPADIISMARIYRRCFPRTERDDQYEDLPTSNFAGNYILKRYGGCFPDHCHYSFYRKYGEYGMGAVTSEYHNFPAGRHPLGPV